MLRYGYGLPTIDLQKSIKLHVLSRDFFIYFLLTALFQKSFSFSSLSTREIVGSSILSHTQ